MENIALFPLYYFFFNMHYYNEIYAPFLLIDALRILRNGSIIKIAQSRVVLQ